MGFRTKVSVLKFSSILVSSPESFQPSAPQVLKDLFYPHLGTLL